MYSSSLEHFSRIPPLDSSADEPANREKYFSLVQKIRDYLGDEKVDYPNDLVYCLDSKDFRSESKMQQEGTVSKLIRHQPFQAFIQMLKRSAALLATDTGEKTEQLTKEQEEAFKDYLTKKQPWEPTGGAWIEQRQYGAKEEVAKYKAFLQKISDQTNGLDRWIAQWQKESEEEGSTQATQIINKLYIDHARWLQRELEELPLEEQNSLSVPMDRFFRQRRAIESNLLLQIGFVREQDVLKKLSRENKEGQDIPKLIQPYQRLRQQCEELVKGILSGKFLIKDVNMLNEAISSSLQTNNGWWGSSLAWFGCSRQVAVKVSHEAKSVEKEKTFKHLK